MDFKNKTVVVTGASGLVGYPTVVKCLNEGAEQVIAADLKISSELQQLQIEDSRLVLKQTDLT